MTVTIVYEPDITIIIHFLTGHARVPIGMPAIFYFSLQQYKQDQIPEGHL